MIRGWFAVLVLLVTSTPLLAQFRAGAFAIDVTPEAFPVVANCMFTEREAKSAADRLHARCLVLDDGKTKLAIVIVDSCMMPREFLDATKELIRESTGIPTERQLISATHTHSAPAAMGCLGSDPDPKYAPFLQAQIVRGVTKANERLAPAKAGWASADARPFTNNRRWIRRPDKLITDPFGNRNVRANMHPGHQNPDTVGPSGPVDPDLSLLAIQTADGQPLAVLANFSMHYYGSPLLSADYFGAFCESFAKKIDPDRKSTGFVPAMSQGTSGDLQWMDYGAPRPAQTMAAYADALAKIAFDAYGSVKFRSDVSLGMAEEKVTFQRRTPDAARLAWAQPILEKLGEKKPLSQQEIYAREAKLMHAEPKRELKLQAVRVGDVGIAAIPNEVYALTGMKIKAFSPLVRTFNIELANGADGYIPPPEQHKLGGYTTWPARSAGLEVGAEPKIVDTVLSLLENVSDQKRRPFAEPASDYAKSILADKPAAFWRLGEMDGRDAADSAGNHVGKVGDGIVWFLEGAPGTGFANGGRGNRSAHFAGGQITSSVQHPGTAYSVELWFWNGLPAGVRPTTGHLFALSDDVLGVDGEGRLFAEMGKNRVTGTTKIGLKTWHHLLLVRDGRKATLYLDGKPEFTGELDSVLPGRIAAFPVHIGGRGDADSTWEGKLDEVAIYPRALTAADAVSRVKVAGN